ncbi:MAG: hypothetical protein K6A90_14195 [Lachnospiraceae bacterium]|nr:hypothetical protein [Lachnospiraceae bacterium]
MVKRLDIQDQIEMTINDMENIFRGMVILYQSIRKEQGVASGIPVAIADSADILKLKEISNE